MKSKFYTIPLFTCAALIHMQAQAIEYKADKPTPQRKSDGLCYCSDKCGPRQVKETDAPFFDKEYGICFCKQRDKDNYIPNGCDLQPEEEFTSICDEE